MSYADMVARSGALQSSFTAVARDPEAGRRGGHRLRPRRRLRARAVRRLPGRGRQRQARPAGDPARRHPRAPAAPSGCRGWSARPGRRTSSSPAGSSTPQEALRDRAGRQGRAGRRGLRRRPRDGRRASSAARRSRCARPRRRSTAAWRPTSPPGSRSSGCSSPGCSPPRTARSAWSRSSRTGRARPSSPAGDAAMSAPNPHPTADEVRGGLDGPQARQRALPRLGGVDVRREVVDLVRRALHRLRP